MSVVININDNKTHYRKAFDSPYLSSADIVEPTVLTIQRVTLEKDKTKKTADLFNTAFFVEKEIRKGEKLKPMILNATNSKTLKKLTGSAFIEDWSNVCITVYVDHNVRFGKESVEGLRICEAKAKKELLPENSVQWESAKNAYKRDKHLNNVLSRVSISDENQALLISQCNEVGL